MTTLTASPAETLKSLELRHAVNEKAHAEGRITPEQFIACRTKLRARMVEALAALKAA